MKTIILNPYDILEVIHTKRDALMLSSEIDRFLAIPFTTTTAVEQLLEEYLPYDKKTKLLQLFSKYEIDIRSPVAIQTFLNTFTYTMRIMPIVEIILAFSPKQEFVTKMSSWFVLYVKKAVLLDISVHESLMGGAIILYNGMRKDYSVKKVLEEKYKKGELNIMK